MYFLIVFCSFLHSGTEYAQNNAFHKNLFSKSTIPLYYIAKIRIDRKFIYRHYADDVSKSRF